MLIDFWATWCPPCQPPMEHNERLSQKFANSGKVRIVGLSLDKEAAKVAVHCNSKRWTSVQHYLVKNEKLCIDLSIQTIPHIMLIDKKGQIVFKG